MSDTIPAPRIETVEISRLQPWDKNPRRGHAVDGIARSIEAFGYLNPIIVQAGTYRILAGHGRLAALQKRGVGKVPVIVAEISDQQAALYTIADNKLGELSSWDEELLGAIVGELELIEHVDLSLTGFTEQELRELEGLTVDERPAGEDDLVEPEADAVTLPGDLWELGAHRVFCGDSTRDASFRAVMKSYELAHLVFTDPPYGVDYKAKKFDLIKNDELKGDRLMKFLAEALSWSAFVAKEDAAFYVWHASSTREEFAAALKMAGLVERQYLIWVKPSIVLGHADYQWQHEPCFYAARQECRPPFFGGRDQATVWRVEHRTEKEYAAVLGSGAIINSQGRRLFVTESIPKGRKIREFRLPWTVGNGGIYLSTDEAATDCWSVSRDPAAEHPTQKPVELSRRAIENSTEPGGIVLDPFLGSGSTLIGCEVTGRVCRGIELSPQYVDVIVRRWQRVTGQKARNLTRTEIVMG